MMTQLLLFNTLISLKSLGHSPAPEFFLGGSKELCLGSDPQNKTGCRTYSTCLNWSLLYRCICKI